MRAHPRRAGRDRRSCVGRPFVERLAARSIEDRIGTPVSVSIATSLQPGRRCAATSATSPCTATQFERNGLRLAGARAVYHGVARRALPTCSRATSGCATRPSTFQGNAHAGRALRPTCGRSWRERGLPSQEAARHDRQGPGDARASARCMSRAAPGSSGSSSIRLVPAQRLGRRSRARSRAPIQLGPLPDGVHLTGIALRKGRATITGGGDGGKLRA